MILTQKVQMQIISFSWSIAASICVGIESSWLWGIAAYCAITSLRVNKN